MDSQCAFGADSVEIEEFEVEVEVEDFELGVFKVVV